MEFSHRALIFLAFLFCLFLSSLASECRGYPSSARPRNEIDVPLFIPQLEGMSSKLAVYLPT